MDPLYCGIFFSTKSVVSCAIILSCSSQQPSGGTIARCNNRKDMAGVTSGSLNERIEFFNNEQRK